MYMLAAGAKGDTQQEIFDTLTKTIGTGYDSLLLHNSEIIT